MSGTCLEQLDTRLATAPIVPLIAENDAERAVETALALKAGGLSVIEVVLRSENALAGLDAIRCADADLIVGAGTVLTLDQLAAARSAGAQFIVSPGLLDPIAELCLAENIPVFPGVMTAGEVQRAYAMGLRTVKFFPASLAGGVPMLKAFAAVFRDMRFMPTGGISAGNLVDYLALPSVLACGGSWLTPRGAEPEVTQGLAREALAIAATARPSG
ncbi:MAG: bifunctional 4-hydroxy-2-oxoglutarate aldolase/2-dehydro-3-deoxy-phosphogluconate aldolase [Erythrobacter sp.]|uniref:bifunctional 4-hydroxy-2-oxoglutarate aldolase/2-dehydro-3-deoxy-phosphogluconate aldolase n=1 Tax=Erythrobacter sp. TaxID=1042 RepID=UPI00260EBB9D|nr:bifunctional 4-hydroxy-2-oxoglutarate aldolase/2-dehydro-3-deoxy-phosphogluconate aldolase [Erythrobacter sp.]MDJ0979631.1 bifunctional 4-hydroxy-2-oxoglutarate aldolase/2-dehydro-3-deoxy-phosphogluconate aldolase [Erythrobacter sp.]